MEKEIVIAIIAGGFGLLGTVLSIMLDAKCK
jgi:hypothetical protein